MIDNRKTLKSHAGRALALGAGLVAAAVLAGCAAGSARPKPAELPPNVALIGVRQAWTARVPAVNFPLQTRVVGNQVVVAGGDGSVVTLDANTGAEVARANVGTTLSAGVGSDGRTHAVVTRDNNVVALEGGREIWRYRLPTQSYTAPLVAGGRVFVLGADRSLTALDGRAGTVLAVEPRLVAPTAARLADRFGLRSVDLTAEILAAKSLAPDGTDDPADPVTAPFASTVELEVGEPAEDADPTAVDDVEG